MTLKHADSMVVRMICLAGSIFGSMGAGRPEVVRVRAPAKDVGKWFPRGSELISLRPEEFEKLVREMRDRVDLPDDGVGQILEAAHTIRWEDGSLRGETLPPRSGAIHLGPVSSRLPPGTWLPKHLPTGVPSCGQVTTGACFSGRRPRVLRKSAWDGVSKHDLFQRDASFFSNCPARPLVTVELSLPDRFEPHGFSSVPGTSAEGRRRWSRLGPASPLEIRLIDDATSPTRERPWVSGSTTIDVGPTSARWRAEWTVALNGRRRSLRVAFSPGLEPIEASGADGVGAEPDPNGHLSEMSIRFRPEAEGKGAVLYRGLCDVRHDGAWPLPAAWPVDGEWIGERVTVRLDRSRHLGSCRLLNALRLASPRGESGENGLLRFEATGTGSAAELLFVPDVPMRRASVRGWVRYTRTGSSIVADVTWSFAPGHLGTPSFDLPERWSIERISSGDVPVTWHGDPTGRGSTRIHLSGTPAAGASTFTIRVGALRTSTAWDGPCELPGIIPVDVASDSIWLATAADGRFVVPAGPEKIAWLDPSRVEAAGLVASIDAGELSRALCWRPLNERLSIDARIAPVPREVQSRIEGDIHISGGRSRVHWKLTIRPGDRPISSIPISWSHDDDLSVRWRLRRPRATAVPINSRVLDPSETLSAGLGGSSRAVSLELVEPMTSTMIIEGVSNRPWTGSGNVPLPGLPSGFNPGSRLTLRVAPNLITEVETRGLRALEDGIPGAPGAELDGASSQEPVSLARVFEYQEKNVSLHLVTSPSRSEAPAAVSARLISSLTTDGTTVHELVLHFASQAPRTMNFTMPRLTSLSEVRQGDRKLEVLTIDDHLMLSLRQGEQVLRIEYAERAPSRSEGQHRLRPTMPSLPVLCTDFRWTLSLPSGMSINAVGRGLTAIDPLSRGSFMSHFGFADDRLSPLRWISSDQGNKQVVLERVRDQLTSIRRDRAPDLGSLLLTLCQSDSDVIVDRLGFREAGLTPESRLSPIKSDPSSVSTEPACLRLGPLRVTPRGGLIAVSPDPSELAESLTVPTSGSEVDDALREAALDGTSSDGRWMAAEEWYLSSSGEGLPSTSRMTLSRNRFDFVTVGWPDEEAWVEPGSESSPFLASILSLTLVLGAALVFRSVSPMIRLVFLLVLTVMLSILIFLPWQSVSHGTRSGIALGLVASWLVQRPSRLRRMAEAPGASGRGGSTIRSVMTFLVVYASSLLPFQSTIRALQAPAEGRILAILPYEGPPNPRSTPDRVLLRLEDHERLRAALDPVRATRPMIFALDSTHHVRVLDERSARLTSEMTLVLDVDSPQEWHVPTQGGRDIKVLLDDKYSPIRLDEEGRSGAVTLQGRGRHRLQIEQTLPVVNEDRACVIHAPINLVSHSNLVAQAPSDWGVDALLDQVIPTNTVGGEIRHSIGGSREIALAWSRIGARSRKSSAGVQGLLLWDATAAGELLRVRLAPDGHEPLHEVRLRVEPGVRVRVADGRRLLRSAVSTTERDSEWFGSFERPATKGEPVELEFWRPGSPTTNTRLDHPRRPPRVTVVGRDFSGLLALRRPGDWNGRLAEAAGFSARDDESFVDSWGALPEDSLTLAGAVAFRGVATPAAAVGPPRLHRTIRTTTVLELGEGRVDVGIEAILRDVSGRSNDLDVVLPQSFVLTKLDATGLSSRGQRIGDRVHVEFSEASEAVRTVTIRGYFLAVPERVEGESAGFHIDRPLPQWSGALEEEGLVALVGGTKAALDVGPEDAQITPAEAPSGAAERGSHRAYRVHRSGDVRAVRWSAHPPRIGVYLQSRLMIDRERLRLDSTLRYEPQGGPLEAIYLKVPTAWADGADVRLIGESYQRTAETRGDWTIWSIRPDRPIWGIANLRVLRTQNISGGSSVSFPDILPLGRGRVDKVVTVENSANHPIEIEGSSGLVAIDPIGVIGDSVDKAPSVHVDAFRVTSEKWALVVRLGAEHQHVSSERDARVISSETRCTLGSAGAVTGLSTFLVDAGLGSMLRFSLAPGARVLHASEGGRPLPVLSSVSGEWLIPFDSTGIFDTRVLWSGEAAGDRHHGQIELPLADRSDTPTLAKIATPPSLSLASASTDIQAINAWSWRVERAERLAKRVIALMETLDRSSASQQSELSGLLTRFLLEERLAQKAAPSDASSISKYQDKTINELVSRRLEQSRQVLLERLSLYGLDEFKAYLEGTGAQEPTIAAGPTIRSGGDSLAAFGAPSYFRSSTGPSKSRARRRVGISTPHALAEDGRPLHLCRRDRADRLGSPSTDPGNQAIHHTAGVGCVDSRHRGIFPLRPATGLRPPPRLMGWASLKSGRAEVPEKTPGTPVLSSPCSIKRVLPASV